MKAKAAGAQAGHAGASPGNVRAERRAWINELIRCSLSKRRTARKSPDGWQPMPEAELRKAQAQTEAVILAALTAGNGSPSGGVTLGRMLRSRSGSDPARAGASSRADARGEADLHIQGPANAVVAVAPDAPDGDGHQHTFAFFLCHLGCMAELLEQEWSCLGDLLSLCG